MKVRYTIEDCQNSALDIEVEFEFHREIDGELVYDAAFTVISADDGQTIRFNQANRYDSLVLAWLEDNEFRIYEAAEEAYSEGNFS